MSNQIKSSHHPALLEKEIPATLRTLLVRMHEFGHEAYCVGGAVRDLIMGRLSGDWDVATSAHPRQVQAIFSKTIETGIEHGTVTVCIDEDAYEVTTYRVDVGISDGRRPEHVTFSSSLLEDLERRDFTINAMAWNPLDQSFYDPFDGLSDIRSGMIRAVGEPGLRLEEDGLRAMRAIRFVSALGFELSHDLKAAIPLALNTFSKVSVERIWQELRKLLVGPMAAEGLGLMEETGMRLRFWSRANDLHIEGIDVLPNEVALRLAFLFTNQPKEFDGCGRALKMSKKTLKRVAKLLEVSQIRIRSESSRLKLLSALSSIGREGVDDWEALVSALVTAGERTNVRELACRFRALGGTSVPLSVGELPIDGKWIIREFCLSRLLWAIYFGTAWRHFGPMER